MSELTIDKTLKKNRPNLVEGEIHSTLRRLATPLALGFVINAIYTWTDMYFVSRLGDVATASLGFADQIDFVIFTLGNGFCMGTGVIVARRMGEGKKTQAEAIVTHAFSFMLIYSILVSILIYLIVPTVFASLGLKGDLLRNSTIYMQTLLIGFPGSMITFQANASVRSTGNTVFPMLVLFCSAILNACVDPILIFGLYGFPKFGIQGAAISTSIAKWFTAILTTSMLFSGRLNIQLYKPTTKINWSIIKNIFKVGLPQSLQTLTVSLSRVFLVSICNKFGTEAGAAYSIAQKVDALAFMPVFAFSIATETMVGQNIGAKKYDRVKKLMKSSILQLSIITLFIAIFYILFAKNIATIFTNTQLVINYVSRYLHVTVLGYFFFIIGITCARSLSGAGHSLRSMIIVSVVLFLFQVPLAYVLSNYTPLGIDGVFWGITISHFCYAIISILNIRGDKWMLKKI